MADKWIPVSERLPKEGQQVKVKGNELRRIIKMKFRNGAFWGFMPGQYWQNLTRVTHWKPEPPEAE